MLHPFFAYIKYFFSARTKYRIHSPYVFDFITQGLEKKLSDRITNNAQVYRRYLYADKSKINVTDFGAGSRVFTSDEREVSQIAKHAGISLKKSILLQKIVNFHKPKRILEIGTSLGLGTASMHYAATKASIISLEGCPQTAAKASSFLKQAKINTVEIVVGEFLKSLTNICKDTVFDLVYFDGNHRKNPTLEYFIQSKKCINNNSLLIFDDIHWSSEMEEAWDLIKADSDVHVSMDLFHLGIISFRKEQVKQDFILRT